MNSEPVGGRINPDVVETIREAVKGGPAWWIYVAFVVLSFLGAALGFQYVGPSDRLAKIEAVNAQQDSTIQRDDAKLDAVLALLCVKTTETEHRLARVNCPTGSAK
jgi:hypothetical protein